MKTYPDCTMQSLYDFLSDSAPTAVFKRENPDAKFWEQETEMFDCVKCTNWRHEDIVCLYGCLEHPWDKISYKLNCLFLFGLYVPKHQALVLSESKISPFINAGSPEAGSAQTPDLPLRVYSLPELFDQWTSDIVTKVCAMPMDEEACHEALSPAARKAFKHRISQVVFEEGLEQAKDKVLSFPFLRSCLSLPYSFVHGSEQELLDYLDAPDDFTDAIIQKALEKSPELVYELRELRNVEVAYLDELAHNPNLEQLFELRRLLVDKIGPDKLCCLVRPVKGGPETHVFLSQESLLGATLLFDFRPSLSASEKVSWEEIAGQKPLLLENICLVSDNNGVFWHAS